MCRPDGPKIRALIYERGYSVAGFARKIGRRKSERNIRYALRVKPGDISDWKNDDDIWDELAAEIAAA